jgi:hypothetical protein
MSIKDLQKTIRKEGCYILSDGTLNLTHLLPCAYDLIVSYNMQTTLKKDIESVFIPTEKADYKLEKLPTYYNQYHGNVEISNSKMEEASMIWNEDIYNYFNAISPNGYYFGSSEGDGALIGWWKIEEGEAY